MKFLAIVIALVLVQVWGSGSPLHRDAWYQSWQARIAALGVGSAIKLALAVLVPVVLVQLVFNALQPILFGLLWIAAAAAVLLYSFGRGDFHAMLARYRGQCRSGDFEGAYLTASSELGWASTHDSAASPEDVNTMVERGFLYEGYQRWFAVLFYFVLLGPAGALAYRLLHMGRSNFEPALARRCLFLADWVPVRLLGGAFTLAGDFVGSRDVFLAGLVNSEQRGCELLHGVALAALGNGTSPSDKEGLPYGERAANQNEELAGLLSRSAVCWVAAIALMVLLL